MSLAIEPHACIVIDIGATHIRVGFADDARPRHVDRSIALDQAALLAAVRALVQRVRHEAPEREPVAVSVGCPGVVREGRVERALYLPLTGVDIAGELRAATGLRAIAFNDIDAHAVGDPGMATGRSFFTIGIGTAVGGALVERGALRVGREGSIAEVGHLPIGGDTTRCQCGGRGCLDAVCSGWALERELGSEWWEREPSELEPTLVRAGTVLSRAVRSVAVLSEVDYVLLIGRALVQPALWTGFFMHHEGMGADVPVTVCRDGWAHAARGLFRLACLHA